VLDNEAGLENLSRRIVTRVDVLAIVADPSARGLETVSRLSKLAKEMDVRYGKLALIVNRLRRDELPAGAVELKKAVGADILLALPDNEELASFAEDGKTVFSLPTQNPVISRIDSFLRDIGIMH
jgi:CO dehydrogenase maturation factor